MISLKKQFYLHLQTHNPEVENGIEIAENFADIIEEWLTYTKRNFREDTPKEDIFYFLIKDIYEDTP